MLSSLSFYFGDGRALPILATAIAVLVIAALAFWIYRLAFANRLRPPGAARGRAPRLGVVDVFGLDGQRQLVIVRRDNVEHLLLLGGPNDIVVEPNISRNAANGRDGKTGAPSEPMSEPAAPIPALAVLQSRPAAALRREPTARPTEPPAPVEPVVVLSETRPRPAPTPRPAAEAPKSEPVKPEPVKPESVKLAPELPKPAVVAEALKPVEPPVRPVEPAPVGEAAAKLAAEAGKPAPEAPRRALATPRPTLASVRPALPPPITPLRSRPASEPTAEAVKAVEPVKPAPSGDVVTLKTVEPPASPGAPAPKAVEVKPAIEAPQSAVKPKKEDTFYDLESLEAEMARLLGRDP